MKVNIAITPILIPSFSSLSPPPSPKATTDPPSITID